MASLVTVKGPVLGQRFALEGQCSLIGRQPDAAVYLESLAVSRQHAHLFSEVDGYVVEDLGSSNGTYVNGQRVQGRVPLTERDLLQVGPYVLALRTDRQGTLADTSQIIRAQVAAEPSNFTLFSQNPAHKLQVVLEISRNLADALDPQAMLERLLEHLLRLFPQADRGMVLLCEGENLAVHASLNRFPGEAGSTPYSRTVVRRALEEGVGLLSEDVGHDEKLVLSATLMSLNLRSFLCVPLIGGKGSRLGVIQLDCMRAGQRFHGEDLELLTAVGLQVAAVLENLSLHGERLRQERLKQELMLAREIQQSFLPTDFELFADAGVELYACVNPAREVSGDLYDFFRLADGRLAFLLGDVSGKGMPAALFMIMVRSLSRHLAPSTGGPAEMLRRLNAALVADNPTALFVTIIHGIFDPRDGELIVAAGGHPPPLIRRAHGDIEQVAVSPGPLLGFSPIAPPLEDHHLTLQRGETLILYTDGFTEAFAPDKSTQFGLERLCDALGGKRTELPLERCAAEVGAAVAQFTQQEELQDDQTLLLLRRR